MVIVQLIHFPTLFNTTFQGENSREHGNGVGEIRHEANSQTADIVYDIAMRNVVDDEVFDTAWSLIEGDCSNHSQGHVHQNGNDHRGNQGTCVLLRFLHGVLKGEGCN